MKRIQDAKQDLEVEDNEAEAKSLLFVHIQETSSSFSASASSSEPLPCSSSVQQLRACSVWLMTVCSFAASSLRA